MQAALLARHGVTGPLDLFENPLGLRPVFSRTEAQAALIAPLADEIYIMRANIKAYPCLATGQAIVAAGLEPKPLARTYGRFLARHGVGPAKAAMFEDLARNLVVPHQLGMVTVLVTPDGVEEVVREDWELEGRGAGHVDHVTDNLTGFLERLTR